VKRFGSVHSPVDAVDKNVLFLENWTYPQLWIIFGGIFDFLPEKIRVKRCLLPNSTNFTSW
jgi:hypothetical protein